MTTIVGLGNYSPRNYCQCLRQHFHSNEPLLTYLYHWVVYPRCRSVIDLEHLDPLLRGSFMRFA